MAQVIEASGQNNENNGSVIQQTGGQPTGGLGGSGTTPNVGNTHLNTFNTAFGMVGDNSTAAQFCAALNELAKNNTSLSLFKWGTVPIAPEYGSVAYVAGEYNNQWLYGLLVFEAGSSVRLNQINNKETYYTIAGLINKDVLAAVEKELSAKGVSPAVYILTNSVPDFANNKMTPQWANSLMGQMQMCIFGRVPGYLSSIVVSKNDKFTATVGTAFDSDALDANNHPNRADITLTLEHMKQNQVDTAPTLLSSSEVTNYPRVVSCGYTNLRVMGEPDQSNGENLKQLQGEVVVSLIDSNVQGSYAPIDRQLLALSGFARIAQCGGWRDSFIQSLSKDKRKLSSVARYLNWGAAGAPDKLTAIDSDMSAKENFLSVFAPASAALIVHHRAGNGVGGLTTLLSEIVLGNTYSLASLMGILDKMFPRLIGNNGKEITFTQRLSELNGNAPVTTAHVTSTAVPTMDGVYVADGHHRTLQDMDALTVLTKVGDNFKDGLEFLHAQSFAQRTKEPMDQRIYLIQMANHLYSANGVRYTGDSLDIAINPVFAKLLVDATKAMCTYNMVGVNNYDENANKLFSAVSGTNLIVGQNQASNGLGSFSLGGATSSFSAI